MTDIERVLVAGDDRLDADEQRQVLERARYSSSGYWNSCTDCQRHMFRFAPEPDTSPFGVTPEFDPRGVSGPTPAMNG